MRDRLAGRVVFLKVPQDLIMAAVLTLTAGAPWMGGGRGVEVLCTTPHIYEQKTAAQQWLRHEHA